MKKILIGILLVLVLFGCEKDPTPDPKEKLIDIKEPIKIEEELYNSKEFIDIDSEKLKSLEEEKKSFAIFIYAPGCLSCAAFRVVLEEFVEEYNMSFYTISTPEMKKTNISEYVTYAPSIVIFKEGEMGPYLDAISDEELKYYETVDGFKEWFTKYVIIEN